MTSRFLANELCGLVCSMGLVIIIDQKGLTAVLVNDTVINIIGKNYKAENVQKVKWAKCKVPIRHIVQSLCRYLFCSYIFQCRCTITSLLREMVLAERTIE